MSEARYPIPARLNLAIAAAIVAASAALLCASGRAQSPWTLLAIAVAYAIVMNGGYAIIHEAEHQLLHPNRRINDLAGRLVSIFFPASFTLRRIGHTGHHLRNRTDDEAFDFYFEGENPFWKHLQFYGILTGFFWLVIFLSNIPAALAPQLLRKKLPFDQPTAALQETLDPSALRVIQTEAIAVIAFHTAMILVFEIPAWNYFITLAGFGFLWSTLQYIHHFGTERDVQRGAANVRLWRIFDWLWLNHQWHLNHHLHPTVPWIHLPQHTPDMNQPVPFWKAYLRMWRGPRFTTQRVPNRHAGRIIQ